MLAVLGARCHSRLPTHYADTAVGPIEGLLDFNCVGVLDGPLDCITEGILDGFAEGSLVAVGDDEVVGAVEGAMLEESLVGDSEDDPDGILDGECEGLAIG